MTVAFLTIAPPPLTQGKNHVDRIESTDVALQNTSIIKRNEVRAVTVLRLTTKVSQVKVRAATAL